MVPADARRLAECGQVTVRLKMMENVNEEHRVKGGIRNRKGLRSPAKKGDGNTTKIYGVHTNDRGVCDASQCLRQATASAANIEDCFSGSQ